MKMAYGTYYQALSQSKPWNVGKKKTEIPGSDWGDIIGTMPSITGAQETVGSPLSEYLSGILSGQPSAGYESMQGQYSQALEDYYQEAIYKPTMQEFTQDIIPQVKESYVATGAITGTEVGDKISALSSRVQQSLLGKKTELAYQDYIARNPATAEILQAALSYLGIPMMAAYQKPEGQTASTGGGGWGASVGFNQPTGSNSPVGKALESSYYTMGPEYGAIPTEGTLSVNKDLKKYLDTLF